MVPASGGGYGSSNDELLKGSAADDSASTAELLRASWLRGISTTLELLGVSFSGALVSGV
jgi:hypothetical protein